MNNYLLIYIFALATYGLLKFLSTKGFICLFVVGIVAMSTLIMTGEVDGRMNQSTIYLFTNTMVFYALLNLVATKGNRKFTIVSAVGSMFSRSVWATIGTAVFIYFSVTIVRSGEGLYIPDPGKKHETYHN